MTIRRVGLIGFGAIAQAATDVIPRYRPDVIVTGVLVRPGKANIVEPPGGARFVETIDELIELAPDGIFECASQQAVRDYAFPVLASGRNLSLVSIGALTDAELLDSLQRTAVSAGATLTILPGALAGLDALAAARLGGLERVVHTVVKPPAAWKGTPAECLVALDRLGRRTVFFEGAAREAAQAYPRNANATAAVALAGAGFDQTKTVLVADPGATTNTHILEASGAFGVMKVELFGSPLQASPRSSMLAALSAARAIVCATPGIHI